MMHVPVPVGAGRRVLAVVLALLALAAAAGTAAAQANSWLDTTPVQNWNTPGMAYPPEAPPPQVVNPRCGEREVAATTPEERQLADRGWKVEAYWPPLPSGNLVLVTALANYDGMCRPLDFNVFVFSSGAYAGTLSPMNMNSRSDGVLATPNGKSGLSIAPDGTVRAVFTRYAPTDPLCCPSLGTTSVTYRIRTTNGGPYVVPISLQSSRPAATAPAPAQIPARMPATGGGGSAPAPALWLPATVAALLAGSWATSGRRGSSAADQELKRSGL